MSRPKQAKAPEIMYYPNGADYWGCPYCKGTICGTLRDDDRMLRAYARHLRKCEVYRVAPEFD